MIEAAKFYAAKNARSLPRKTVAEVCAEMLDAKTKDGVSDGSVIFTDSAEEPHRTKIHFENDHQNSLA